jgi:membrane protein YqaA with SNARE-associated domain
LIRPVRAILDQGRRLYNWVLHWANTPYGVPALAVLAFVESSFFPIPPDVLLIALCVGLPKGSARFALVCSIASVLGGMAGYGIGVFASDLGHSIIAFFGAHYVEVAKAAFAEYGAWAVATAGLTPIPYKVFTISSGIFHEDIPFGTFVLASALSRSARFFAVALLIQAFGEPVKRFIDKWFDVLSVTFVVLLIGGFVVIKWVMGG